MSPIILEHSLFIFSIKKEWLFNKCKKDNSNNILHQFNMHKNKEFIKLLKYKYSQGLLICLNNKTNKNTSQKIACLSNTKINPIWFDISNKLTTIFNSNTNTYHNALVLNKQYWLYNNPTILNELTNNIGNFNSIKYLLNHSNKHLNIISSVYVYSI